MLKLNIYGLRVAITFRYKKTEQAVARILNIFLQENLEAVDVFLNHRQKYLPRAIGSQIFPLLAKKDIWGMHAGGFHLDGGLLTIGHSNCGKSTLSYMAYKKGLVLVSDDITLLRESQRGIEMLPFFASIFLKNEKAVLKSGLLPPTQKQRPALLQGIAAITDLLSSIFFLKAREIVPEPGLFKPAILKYLIFPKHAGAINSTCVKRVAKKVDLMKKISPQFLWSYEKEIQKQQSSFLEKLCGYPAFEISLAPDLLNNFALFEEVLNEISQG